MKIFSDLQIHSLYSRATSKSMNLDEISEYAKIKGINLLGTGDFTHPLWLKELKKKLTNLGDGIFTYNNVYWIISGEVSLVYEKEGKTRKVHLLVYSRDFECAEQLNERLSKYSNLSSDGRPIINNLSSPEFLEIVSSISSKMYVIPAHAWTPWFSIFGSKSGFDSVRDCFEDMTGKIFAIETGLSSDPPMNWRISFLDDFSLISNSDSHSPSRIGREANVFELEKVSYDEIFKSIMNKDRKKFLYTIEVDPSYGKYHFSGHRKCNYSADPEEVKKNGGICKVCGKKLTIGVMQRVEELADRPQGYRPRDAIDFIYLLPLDELITLLARNHIISARQAREIYSNLIKSYGSELNAMLNSRKEELEKVASESVAKAIISVREGRMRFIPGYDGKYGIPLLEDVKGS